MCIRDRSYVIQDRLVRYRIHSSNLTHSKSMKMRSDAFRVVRDLLTRSIKLSDQELSAFERLFQYETLTDKQTITGFRLFLKILRIHRGPETLRRFMWFLSSRVPRPQSRKHEDLDSYWRLVAHMACSSGVRKSSIRFRLNNLNGFFLVWTLERIFSVVLM